MRTKISATLAAAAVSAFVVSGCTDNPPDSSMEGHSMATSSTAQTSTPPATASVEFNDADVIFAKMMYPHHAQAVEMAAMAVGRTDNQEVLSLAAAIESAQQPEMDQLTAWLAQWGQPAPSAGMGEMSGMDHSSQSGMMTQQDMDALMSASGPDFDRLWLTMMIAHHTGAIEMANVEIAQGSNPDAIQMARTIAESQQREIDAMRQLLG